MQSQYNLDNLNHLLMYHKRVYNKEYDINKLKFRSVKA